MGKKKEDDLKTRVEDGYRVSESCPNLRFPTDDLLQSTVEKYKNEVNGHGKTPCAPDSDCEVCFNIRAVAESELFLKFVDTTFYNAFGPLALIGGANTFKEYYTTMYMMFWLGRNFANGNPVKAKEEVETLAKLFALPSPEKKSKEGDELSKS
jgi:hypothetical protein